MNIFIATTDEEIAACYPVMHELRPQLTETAFVPRIRQLMAVGYQLAVLVDHDEIVAVAGFRIGENLAWGRLLYVDDLVTRAERRSSGYGAALLNWSKDFAAKAHRHQLHLDSGAWRKDAHRFYEREGMTSLQKAIVSPQRPQRSQRLKIDLSSVQNKAQKFFVYALKG